MSFTIALFLAVVSSVVVFLALVAFALLVDKYVVFRIAFSIILTVLVMAALVFMFLSIFEKVTFVT